jgi:hypothetical protein
MNKTPVMAPETRAVVTDCLFVASMLVTAGAAELPAFVTSPAEAKQKGWLEFSLQST